jgi:hypothetical protein
MDWVPRYLHPSGACLSLGTSILDKPLNAAEGYTKPGLRLFRCTLANLLNTRLNRNELDFTVGQEPPWQ